MSFKVGDKVVISRDSEYYGDDPQFNPTDDIIGTICSIDLDDPTRHCYLVYWGDNCSNSYREEDLVSIHGRTTWRGSTLRFSFV